jgi:hypothetical protein
MDENLNENVSTTPSVGAEELKNETQEAINQVKENLKNVDVKEEAKATKGFVVEMLKNPLDKISEIANDKENRFFKTAIVLAIVWTIVEMISGLDILFNEYGEFFENIMGFLKISLRPIISILAMSLVMFWLNKKEKKSLATYITTITTAKLPIIAADLISLLTMIDYSVSKITGKVYTFANLISTVLIFFAIKLLSNESDDKKAFRKFVIVEAVWIGVYFVISFLGISMS